MLTARWAGMTTTDPPTVSRPGERPHESSPSPSARESKTEGAGLSHGRSRALLTPEQIARIEANRRQGGSPVCAAAAEGWEGATLPPHKQPYFIVSLFPMPYCIPLAILATLGVDSTIG